MVIAINFRHGLGSPALRSYVGNQCLQIKTVAPKVTRVVVEFFKEGRYKEASTYITCHISLQGDQHRKLDIYERQSQLSQAFDIGLDKVIDLCLRQVPANDEAFPHHAVQQITPANEVSA